MAFKVFMDIKNSYWLIMRVVVLDWTSSSLVL